MPSEKFELTYASMFNPPESLHTNYQDAMQDVRSRFGQTYGHFINGQDHFSSQTFEKRSPINQDWVLGHFQQGNEKDAQFALESAQEAFKVWGRMPWQERIALLRKAASLIDERIYTIASVITLEVGKNRMEALGDIAEAAALIRYACDQVEKNNGYVMTMGKDPLPGFDVDNVSHMRPYGVWLVISPFNFPAALSAGPYGAALAAGNTVVTKPASDTPWTSRMLAEVFRDAGLPEGVMNMITGPGRTVGETLIKSDIVAGYTFTGSYDVGMHIYRTVAQGPYPRPTVLEMGGKNPSIVTRNANLDDAASGIIRSAFGLQGQKCSANSRVYIEKPVYDELVRKLVEGTEALKVGDPGERETFMGPVVNRNAFKDFVDYNEELHEAGTILTGGKILPEGDLRNGFFCAPTIAAEVPHEHRLWKHEMFLPITLVTPVDSLDQAMELANDVDYGLTSGFYGSEEEVAWYFDNINAGVNYANRPQGSTTGAWPGYQPFGGWKGSGSTGKNAGGVYYLPMYMREQVRTTVRR